MSSTIIDRLDGLSSSAAIKGPVKAATTGNIALYGEQTVDGVSVVTGDRVLVKDQTAAYENGIYRVDTGQWKRTRDFDKNQEVVKGTQVVVTEGLVNASRWFGVSSDNPVNIGTSAISFSFFEIGQRINILTYIPILQWPGIIDGTSEYDCANAWFRVCAEAKKIGGSVFLPSGRYVMGRTIVLPGGMCMEGSGRADRWGTLGNVGTQIVPPVNVAAFAGSRWSDEDGSDSLDYKPLLVLGGSGCTLRSFSLVCSDTRRLDCALMAPTVKQTNLYDVGVQGPWASKGTRLDCTWPGKPRDGKNLSQLHPEIICDTGMNEFNWFGGLSAGVVGFSMKGTTRDLTMEPDPNLWAPGGGSDVSLFGVRVECVAVGTLEENSGAQFEVDAAVNNSAGAIQGIRAWGCSFRGGGDGDTLRFDRANRVELFGCYSEVPSGHTAKLRGTSRTGKVYLYGGRYIRQNVYNNGISTGQTPETYDGNLSWLYIDDYAGRRAGGGWVLEGSTQRPSLDGGGSIGTASANVGAVRTKVLRGDTGALSVRGQDSVDVKVASETIVAQAKADGLRVQSKLFGLGAPVVHTIASDAITVTASNCIVDTEAGAAADNLATINGGENGDIIMLMTVSSSRDVTVKDGTGNISLPADVVLDSAQDALILTRRDGVWYALAPFANNN